MIEMSKTYAGAGVDVKKEAADIKALAEIVKQTFKFRDGRLGEVRKDIGFFAGLIEFGDKYLVFSADGVGSKVIVAQMADKYDAVGIDMIAMNVNDVICTGAEPFALVDYLAMEKTNAYIMREIANGLCKGAEQANIAIVGGETATLKNVIKGIEGKGFDLAGACLGFVDKSRVITGEKVKIGDSIIGLQSSGIHSNGLTLAQEVLFEHYKINDKLPWNKTVAEELLTPTIIYVRPVLDMLENNFESIHGLANITGSGLTNILRLNPNFKYEITDLLPTPLIFDEIQKLGNVSNEEMYKTFNMGVGFVIISDKPGNIINTTNKFNINAAVIGKVIEGKGLYIKQKDVYFSESIK